MKLPINPFNSKSIKIHSKNLKAPSFFMISNLGGGGSDKYRETVYLDLFQNTPCLYNYHYLKKAQFASIWLKQLNKYDSFDKFINFTRNDMIENKKYYSNEYTFNSHDPHKTIYLLDSGAANIINNMLENLDMTSCSFKFEDHFMQPLFLKMEEYYSFANRFKFDIVIGFDIGGKYTFKGEERSNHTIKQGNTHIKNNSNYINNRLLEQTIIYLQTNFTKFYPKIYATVHGGTPQEYHENISYILELEKKFAFKFDGFALGGIANSKTLDKKRWNLSNKEISKIPSLPSGKKEEICNAIIASYACRIVKNAVGNRPIHALGAGGKLNILPLYYSGATSFDSQTPGRRAYDGNGISSQQIFIKSSNESFSKYLIPIINRDLTFSDNLEAGKYKKLNTIQNEFECSCPICTNYPISKIKNLYSKKSNNNEYYYLSRQLINAHSIFQHNLLCKFVHNDDYNKFIDDTLNYIINEFKYEIED